MPGNPVSQETITQQQASHGEATPEQKALTAQLSQLPGYQQHIATIMKGSSLPERYKSYNALMTQATAAGINIPEDMKLDMFGAVRDMTWAEKHPKLFATMMVGGSLAGLAGGAAAAGAFGGSISGGTAAAALGPTTSASMAGTSAALAGSTVPASLAATTPTIAAGGGLSAATKFLTSPAGASLVSGGLQAGMGIANNKANAAEGAANRQQQRDTLLSQIGGDEQQDNLSRDTAYLNSTQMNPVKQQQDIFRAGIMRAMGQQGAPQIQRGQGVVNKFDAAPTANQYLGDESLANAASRFYGAAGTVSNNAPPADLSKMGFNTNTEELQSKLDTSISDARQGRDTLAQQRRDALLGRITPPKPPIPATDYFNRRK